MTGRAPAVGLHTDEGRRARAVVRVDDDVRPALLEESAGLAALGHVIGAAVIGETRPQSIRDCRPDRPRWAQGARRGCRVLRAAVAMFHAVGLTPEAPTLEAALGGGRPELEFGVGAAELRAARDELGAPAGAAVLGAVSLGTPHASAAELERIDEAVEGERPIGAGVRERRTRRPGGATDPDRRRRRAAWSVVSDTCTYLVPVIADADGCVMTDSGKWAW